MKNEDVLNLFFKYSGIILLYTMSIIAFVFIFSSFFFCLHLSGFYFNEIKKNIGGTSEAVLSYLQEQKTQQ